MNVSWTKEPALLALYFNTRGFGYVLFEGLMDPVDWGIKTRPKTRKGTSARQVRQVVQSVDPSIVVLQNCDGPLMRCSTQVKQEVAKTEALARRKGLTVHLYSRDDIRGCFTQYKAQNKVEIARTIAERLPEFRPRVPPKRKPWMTEDFHMALFDAAALGFTHYWKEQPDSA